GHRPLDRQLRADAHGDCRRDHAQAIGAHSWKVHPHGDTRIDRAILKEHDEREDAPMATERRHNPPTIPDDYAAPRRISYEEYQLLDEQLPVKYEYHDGLMYPRFYPPGSHWSMAGGTEAHVQIIVRLLVALAVQVGNHGPCRVYSSDMKLKAGSNEYYPDAYVVCNDSMQPN